MSVIVSLILFEVLETGGELLTDIEIEEKISYELLVLNKSTLESKSISTILNIKTP